MLRLRLRLLCLTVTCIAASCGGGGSDTTPTTQAPTSNPNAYPTARPAAGDWYVYTSSESSTLPAVTGPTEHTVTRHYQTVNSDGSFTLADTESTSDKLFLNAVNSAGALESYTYDTQHCDYAPAYRFEPPLSSLVGDTFNSRSSVSCATQSNGTTSNRSLSVTGTNQALEERNIALGAFNTFKFTSTVIDTLTTSVRTIVRTCWIDKATGAFVECTVTFSKTLAGQNTPSEINKTKLILVAYGHGGQVTAGAAVQRFSGYWNVTLSGSSVGDCAKFFVDINGQISGSCQFFTATGASGAPISISGSVAADGSATVTAATGASFSGSFTSPGAASGTWVNGGTLGTWSATHL
jgi:hypothetical protein